VNERADVVECPSCHRAVSELVQVTTDDTQGYSPSGIKVCSSCLSNIRYEAFQLEDEDLYDLQKCREDT